VQGKSIAMFPTGKGRHPRFMYGQAFMRIGLAEKANPIAAIPAYLLDA